MSNKWNRIMSQGITTSDLGKVKRIVAHMDTVEEMTLRDFKILLELPEDRFDIRDQNYIWIKSNVDIRTVDAGTKYCIVCKFKQKEG